MTRDDYYNRPRGCERRFMFLIAFFVMLILVCSCRGTYYAYQRHNFVPPSESKIKGCMGKHYEARSVNTSMRYYYKQR
jgi:hypothetical protein